MDVKYLAATLLLGHTIALAVTVMILARQVRILHSNPDPELRAGRYVLLALAIIIGMGNFIPMAIDVGVLLGVIDRAQPSLYGVLYSLSNVLTLIFSASAVLALYIIADRLFRKLK